MLRSIRTGDLGTSLGDALAFGTLPSLAVLHPSASLVLAGA